MNQNKRIEGLDVLRAIAIIGVTFFHMFPSVVKGGYLGVILFFVLTGFLLTYTSQEKIKNKSFSILSYYKSRIKRIYPHLLLMTLTTLGIFFLFAKSALNNPKAETLSILFGLNNYYQIHQNLDYFTKITNSSPFSHLWFLSIELQFYLIFPFLLLALNYLQNKKGRKKTKEIFIGLLLILSLIMPIKYLLGTDVTTLYYSTDTRIFSILAGMFLGLIYKHKPENNAKELSISIFLLIICYFIFDGQDSIVYLCILWLITILSMFIIQLTANHKKPLNNFVLNWIGKHSYELYLWQYPIIYLFQYLGWNKHFISYIFECILLFFCVIWSNFIFKSIPLLKKKSQLKKVIIPCLVLSLTTQCIGVYACFTIKPTNTNELQEKIKKNKKKIKKSNQSNNSENIETQEAKDVDYSSSGNSTKVSDQGMVFLGDSVMLAASDSILNLYPDASIDAEVSRHVGQEQQAYQQFLNEGKVHNTVVIALGTNGTLYDNIVEQTLSLIGEDHSILWVNNYCPTCEWQDSNNAYLQQVAQNHSNVTIIDWYSLIKDHPEWLWDDGIHPNDEGCIQYANLIQQNIDDIMNKQKELESKN